MSVNPRSYRVPVLRLTDVYQGDSVNGDPGSNDLLEQTSATPAQPAPDQSAQVQTPARDTQTRAVQTSHNALADLVPEEPTPRQGGQNKDEYVGEPVPKFDTTITYTPATPKPLVTSTPPAGQTPSRDPVGTSRLSGTSTPAKPAPIAPQKNTREDVVASPVYQKVPGQGVGVSPWTLNPSPDRPDTLARVPVVEPVPPSTPPAPKPLVAPLKKIDDPLKAPMRPNPPDMWEMAESKPVSAPPPQKAKVVPSPQKKESVHVVPEKPVVHSAAQDLIDQTLAGIGVKSTPATGGDLATLRARISDTHTEEQKPAEPKMQPAPQTPHVPETEHAKALADVARNLHTIQHDSTELMPDMQNASSSAPTPPRPAPISTSQVRHADFYEEELVVTPAQKEGPSSPVPMIRTFKADVEHAITHNKVSVVNMIAEEEKKRYEPKERTEVRRTKKRHINIRIYALVLGGVGLLMGTIAVGFFVAGIILEKREEHTTSEIFFSDAGREFDITDKDRTALMKGLTDLRDTVDLDVNETVEIRIIEQVAIPGTQETQRVPVSASAFLSAIETRAPDHLRRTLYDSFIFGVYRDDVGKRNPFFIFKVRTFGIAFPGMLEWEVGLDVDLAPLFGVPVSRDILERATAQVPNSETRNDSSDAPSPSSLIDVGQIGLYDDVDISNQAVRALRNADGEIQLLWTIVPGSNMLIITTDPETFQEVRKRTQV